MVNNPFQTVILGDFNVKLSPWYNNDISTYEGSKINRVTLKCGLKQMPYFLWRLLNFETVSCGAYQRAALIRRRLLFQSKGTEQC